MRDYIKRFISSAVKTAECLSADEHCAKGIILLYHSIGAADRSDYLKLRVDNDSFNRQMEYLREKKYNVVPLTELINKLNSGAEMRGQKFISLTFDDGYADNLEFAAPVLKKYGFSAVFVKEGVGLINVFLANGNFRVIYQLLSEKMTNPVVDGVAKNGCDGKKTQQKADI